MILSNVFASKVYSAEKGYGTLYNDGSYSQIKSGKYYYTFQTDGLHLSSSKGTTGELLLENNRKGYELSSKVFLSAKYIYYLYYNNKSFSVYQCNVDGTGEKKIAVKKVKFQSGEGIDIQFVYHDKKIILQRNILGDAMTYLANIKTKKIDAVSVAGKKKHYAIDYMLKQYKSYYVGTGQYMSVTDTRPVYVYNVNKKSVKKLEENARGISIGGSHIYYIEYHRGDTFGKLFQCNMKGKGKKMICSLNTKSDNGPMLVDATDKYCIYSVWYSGGSKTEYYKYNFASQNTTKLKKYHPK